MHAKHRRLVQDSQEFIDMMKSSFKDETSEEKLSESEDEAPNLPEISFSFGPSWPEPKKNERKEIITYIEQYYKAKGTLPEPSDFKLNFPKLALDEDFYQSLQEPLTNRG